uniref:Uncharacterized protein n=1 Tax=Knipowitschia caucasica TaxID=637954 RepID=A0AAV2K6P4_KNICA
MNKAFVVVACPEPSFRQTVPAQAGRRRRKKALMHQTDRRHVSLPPMLRSRYTTGVVSGERTFLLCPGAAPVMEGCHLLVFTVTILFNFSSCADNTALDSLFCQ